jgi:dUTP pyrophosphatase
MEVELRVLDARLHEWGLPSYQSAHAAAVDLHACLDAPLEIAPGASAVLISSGIAIHIADPGVAALVLPRSGLGHRKGLVLGNLIGLIDPDYTGYVTP